MSKIDHIVFIHLDWGLGGAEQLMLQLAQASRNNCNKISLITTRCEQDHCFAALKKSNINDESNMYNNLTVAGKWIPADIDPADLIVMDVLSTPLPLLQYFTSSSLLFYCHFPDQLLKQQQQQRSSSLKNTIKKIYLYIMNTLEAYTMRCSDMCVVNSYFTQSVVRETFGYKSDNSIHTNNLESDLPVLYPALEINKSDQIESVKEKEYMIVSLNRYERKKNVMLLLRAIVWIRTNCEKSVKLPKVIIAGGYDTKNAENVHHYNELETYVTDNNLNEYVVFKRSISDQERQNLLSTAMAVIYTPSREHFGIVPLEAMYAGTPVIACKSGGPTETIVHEKTGYLCKDDDEQDFGEAIQKLLLSPEKATEMGQAGRKHVIEKFGPERLEKEWTEMCKLAHQRGIERVAKQKRQEKMATVSLMVFILACLVSIAFLHLGKDSTRQQEL